MSAIEFCDTNVLLYAHDTSAALEKRAQAQNLLERLWMSHRGCLSTLVLQKLYVNIVRLTRDTRHAQEIVRQYLEWPIITVEPQDLIRAMEQSARYRLSFWDALIVTAAQKAHASVLWTEDLNSGQRLEGVVIGNPLTSVT